MKKFVVLFIVAVCAVGIQAANIPLVNGGFEEPWADYWYTAVEAGVGIEVVPGWTVSQGIAYGGVTYADYATEGYQTFWIQTNNGIHDMPYDLGNTQQAVRQITGSSAVEGKEYTLNFDYTGAYGWANLKELSARILIDGVAVSSIEAYDIPAGVGWFNYSTSYLATAADAGKTLGVEFYFDNLNNPAWHSQNIIDNVQLTEVPEPATLVILSIGGIALFRKRK